MKKFLRKYITEGLLVAGCGCILIGLALWSTVATWIVAGLMLIGWYVLIEKYISIGKVKSNVIK